MQKKYAQNNIELLNAAYENNEKKFTVSSKADTDINITSDNKIRD